MSGERQILNYVGGQWKRPSGSDELVVYNPATGEVLARGRGTSPAELDEAAQLAARAFAQWRRTPATERVQYLFRLKQLLEENLDDLARTITEECGKTYEESAGELRRG
ncbi:MAG: methylmalonate-semialdehyde dehydrogenase (CoA acylating), partial [candidate division GAL15 bacterium]